MVRRQNPEKRLHRVVRWTASEHCCARGQARSSRLHVARECPRAGRLGYIFATKEGDVPGLVGGIVEHQHIRHLHQHPGLGGIDAIFGKDEIIGDINTGMKDLATGIGQSNNIAKGRILLGRDVFGAEHFRGISTIEEIRIRDFIEEVHRGKEAILAADTRIIPGIRVGIEAQPCEDRQEIGNVEGAAARHFCQ